MLFQECMQIDVSHSFSNNQIKFKASNRWYEIVCIKKISLDNFRNTSFIGTPYIKTIEPKDNEIFLFFNNVMDALLMAF